MVATLPYNHIFGPAYRVSFHEEDGIWQLMVLVDSIFNDKASDKTLKAWVTISSGTTQWARWQTSTGVRPQPPPADSSIARGDPGCTQTELPEGLLGDGPNGLERWQDNVPINRQISKEQRFWTILPCSGREDFKPWLLKFALQILRHDNMHESYDGAVHFVKFYAAITKKAWKHDRDACKRFCRSPLHLIQALIQASPTPTFAGAWFMAKSPGIKDLKWARHEEQSHESMARLIPIYIRSLHGHSNIDRTVPIPWGLEWQIMPYHTTHVYHSGKSGNLDSIIRCG